MVNKRKIFQVIIVAVIVLAIIFGLLVYYQSQGLIKIFPTKEDRLINSLLEIDKNKFKAAQGLEPEKFNQVIEELIKTKELILKDKNNPTAWDDFGRLKKFLNDNDGAIKAWEKSFQLQPYNFRTALNLANTYQYFIKDFTKAEFYYNKVLELQPSMTSAFSGLMDLYRFNFKEKKDRFEPLVIRAIEADPSNAAGYYSNLVDFFMAADNLYLNKAKNYWQKVKELDSKIAAELLANYPALK